LSGYKESITVDGFILFVYFDSYFLVEQSMSEYGVLNKYNRSVGFSGNALLDYEIAEVMSSVDAGVYVLDFVPNASFVYFDSYFLVEQSMSEYGVLNKYNRSAWMLIPKYADGEATVDGIHFTDLGMMRYADLVCPVIKKVLKK